MVATCIFMIYYDCQVVEEKIDFLLTLPSARRRGFVRHEAFAPLPSFPCPNQPKCPDVASCPTPHVGAKSRPKNSAKPKPKSGKEANQPLHHYAGTVEPFAVLSLPQRGHRHPLVPTPRTGRS